MRRIALAAVFFSVGVAACGGGKGTGKPADTPTSDVIKPPATANEDADSDAGSALPPVPAALTSEDCEALLGHMFTLMYQQKVDSVPEAEQPSPEDMQVAKDSLRSELMQSCQGAARQTFAFDCVMATTTIDQMAACEPVAAP